MLVKQKQALEAFGRALAFVEAHPITGPLGYTGAREALVEAVRRLREHAGAQVAGRALSHGALHRRKQLVRQLYDCHMRPIVTVARAQIDPGSDVRMPVALRMPPGKLGVTKVLQWCDGMIEAAREFEAVFVANGLPVDFLARFASARNALEQVLGGRATFINQHVGARAGLKVELLRGRRALDRLDAVVRAAFDGDEMVLTTWRTVKRTHLAPGGRTADSTAQVPEEPQLLYAPVLQVPRKTQILQMLRVSRAA